MNDMSSVIVPKSDQINADDLMGGDREFSITGVAIRPGAEQPVAISLMGEDRVWRPCKSMSRVLVAAWGADAKAYAGRSVRLYRDPSVKWGGLEVGGIRIRALSHIERPLVLALTATKGSRKPYTVQPMPVGRSGAGMTVADAESLIVQAKTMDELRTVWSRPDMKPFRSSLKDAQELRKSELSRNDGTLSRDNPAAREGRDDDDMGERITDEVLDQFGGER